MINHINFNLAALNETIKRVRIQCIISCVILIACCIVYASNSSSPTIVHNSSAPGTQPHTTGGGGGSHSELDCQSLREHQLFSPGHASRGGGSTIYSFSANQNVNYSLDASAYFDPITCGAYLPKRVL